MKTQLVAMYLEFVCDLPSNVLASFRALHSPRFSIWYEVNRSWHSQKLHKLLLRRNENLILGRYWPKAKAREIQAGGWGELCKMRNEAQREKGREG